MWQSLFSSPVHVLQEGWHPSQTPWSACTQTEIRTTQEEQTTNKQEVQTTKQEARTIHKPEEQTTAQQEKTTKSCVQYFSDMFNGRRLTIHQRGFFNIRRPTFSTSHTETDTHAFMWESRNHRHVNTSSVCLYLLWMTQTFPSAQFLGFNYDRVYRAIQRQRE